MTNQPTSDAAWFSIAVRRIAAARSAGGWDDVERLKAYVAAERSPALVRLEQVLSASDMLKVANELGLPPLPQDTSLAEPGQGLCDFCATSDPVAYYPVTEFSIVGAGAEWLSGDRSYACTRCHELIEAGDWKGLRAWVGVSADPPSACCGPVSAVRTGPAVDVEPGATT